MLPTLDRLMSKTAATQGGCVTFIGARNNKGYGVIRHNGKNCLAHRVAYELLVGAIPEGLVVDHRCRNTACVNPHHLEPVTFRENVLRGTSPTAVNARKTHCPKGHAYVAGNLIGRRRERRGRECATCNRERARFRYIATPVDG